ncbi:hypothetical protein, partial [Pseudomonas aeruginosa]|uniref:hypothetical protein n=1 Tax=Pseudomonas aeruginosa TaxID=287 RepID=UPI003CC61335
PRRGVRAIRIFEVVGGRGRGLWGRLGWRHTLRHTTPQRHLAFASGSQPFSEESVALSRDAAVLGVDGSLAVYSVVRVR